MIASENLKSYTVYDLVKSIKNFSIDNESGTFTHLRIYGDGSYCIFKDDNKIPCSSLQLDSFIKEHLDNKKKKLLEEKQELAKKLKLINDELKKYD